MLRIYTIQAMRTRMIRINRAKPPAHTLHAGKLPCKTRENGSPESISLGFRHESFLVGGGQLAECLQYFV